MDTPNTPEKQAPSGMLIGALTHLTQYIESGCPRSAYLATLLLREMALDQTSDANLRQQAWRLVDTLEQNSARSAADGFAPAWQTSSRGCYSSVTGGVKT